jgi:prepilin signal peptidase PulO-like enzyme (type II secretory pathway)
MMPIEELLNNLLNLNLSIWLMVKFFVLLALFVYIVFAFLVVREVDLMTRTVKDIFNLPIKIISWLHLVFSLLIFLLALIIL